MMYNIRIFSERTMWNNTTSCGLCNFPKLIKFNEDISKDDLDVIATEIKNFENVRYVEKINEYSMYLILYIADPFGDKMDKIFKTKIDSCAITLSRYCSKFEENLYHLIGNYYKKVIA